MQPLGISSYPCPQASPPPLAHLLPCSCLQPPATTAPSLHLGMPGWQGQLPPPPQAPGSLTAPWRAPHPPPLPQKHPLSPFPNKLPRGGSGGHNPVKPLSSPKMAPPFPLVDTEASLGCPCPCPAPKCIWAQRVREVEDRQPGVGRDSLPASLPGPRTSRGHHQPTMLIQARGDSSCPAENSDLRSPDPFPTPG